MKQSGAFTYNQDKFLTNAGPTRSRAKAQSPPNQTYINRNSEFHGGIRPCDQKRSCTTRQTVLSTTYTHTWNQGPPGLFSYFEILQSLVRTKSTLGTLGSIEAHVAKSSKNDWLKITESNIRNALIATFTIATFTNQTDERRQVDMS